jgi:hypothetical protein
MKHITTKRHKKLKSHLVPRNNRNVQQNHIFVKYNTIHFKQMKTEYKKGKI